MIPNLSKITKKLEKETVLNKPRASLFSVKLGIGITNKLIGLIKLFFNFIKVEVLVPVTLVFPVSKKFLIIWSWVFPIELGKIIEILFPKISSGL